MEWEPVFKGVICANNTGDGESRLKFLVFGVCREEFFGSIVHLLVFLGGNLVDWGATIVTFVVFDFCEVDFCFVKRDQIDFVSFGFEVLRDNLMTK